MNLDVSLFFLLDLAFLDDILTHRVGKGFWNTLYLSVTRLTEALHTISKDILHLME